MTTHTFIDVDGNHILQCRLQLKSCPFCGGAGEIFTIDGSEPGFYIMCSRVNESGCQAYVTVGPFSTMSEAFAVWNKRAI